MNIEAVRAVNNLLKRQLEPNYPKQDMDGSAYQLDEFDMDSVIDAVASAYGIDPFDLWDDLAEWTQEQEYQWWNANVKMLNSKI